jgi:hypothetical protein
MSLSSNPSSTKTRGGRRGVAAGRHRRRLGALAMAVGWRPCRRFGNGGCTCRPCRPCRRAQGAVLVRPDGADAALRQARQVALHGHAAGAALRRRGGADAGSAVSGVAAGACSRWACASPRPSSACCSSGGRGGHGQLNERDVSIVQARANGFVERVHPRAPGDVIPAGAPLAEVLLPDWLAAQREYLAVKAPPGRDPAHRRPASGCASGHDRRGHRAGGASGNRAGRDDHGTPAAGRPARRADGAPGMTVAAGMSLARVNGLGTVWVEAAVPQAQGPLLRVGQPAELLLPGEAGEVLPRQDQRQCCRRPAPSQAPCACAWSCPIPGCACAKA